MSICWGIAWEVAVSRGRSWCGNWCPRGILMGMLTWRASMAWGTWPKELCPQSALRYQLRVRPALAGAAGGVDA